MLVWDGSGWRKALRDDIVRILGLETTWAFVVFIIFEYQCQYQIETTKACSSQYHS